jgi:GMP synthase-like glutamine amidotransferase
VKVLFVLQDHVSDPGPVGEAFAGRAYEAEQLLVVPAERFSQPDVRVVFPDPADYDAIVPMGAPWSVYDEGSIGSWIRDELAFLRGADAAGVPVLGICFGGQALAAALGGDVHRAPTGELGWVAVQTDDPGLVEEGPWFQWHQDRWSPPPGAREIARTDAAPQAFVLRRNLAVQFHPELTALQLAGWLDNGGAAYVTAHGLDPRRLHDETVRREQDAAGRSRRLVHRFLDQVAVRPPVAAGQPPGTSPSTDRPSSSSPGAS